MYMLEAAYLAYRGRKGIIIPWLKTVKNNPGQIKNLVVCRSQWTHKQGWKKKERSEVWQIRGSDNRTLTNKE